MASVRSIRASGLVWTALGCLLQAALATSAIAAPCRDAIIDAQAQLQLDEGRLICVIDMQIRADGQDGLSCKDAPLALPLLAPVAGKLVLDQGTLPPNSQHVEVEAPDGVVVAKRDGALWLASDVTPTQAAGLRVRYPIAFAEPKLNLGIRGAGLKTWYSVVLQSAPPARVQLTVSAPSRVSRLEQGTERLVGAALAQPLPRSAVAVFTLGDLPAAPREPGRSLAMAAGVLVLLAAGLGLRSRQGPR